jgi:hypothetical protein
MAEEENIWASLATMEEPAPDGVGTVTVIEADAGVEAVNEAMAEAMAQPGDESRISQDPNKSAEQLLKDVQRERNWDSLEDSLRRRRYFTIQVDQVNTEDPASDEEFFVKREVAARRAFLRAKAEVARWMFTEMSARDHLEYPGSVLQTRYGKEYDAAKRLLAAQKQTVARLLKQFDEAEAAQLAGATTEDRIRALMDAAIKKLDASYSAEAIEQSRAEAFERVKTAYQEAIRRLQELEEQSEELKQRVVSTFESGGTELASMPVSGATVIDQAESWDPSEKKYHVAVLLCWSPVLEKAAQLTLAGKTVAVRSESEQTPAVVEWLRSQNLASMAGPRQFLDQDGNRWYLGISSRPTSNNAAVERKNRSAADYFSRQLAVYSLFSQVDSFVAGRIVARELMSAGAEMATMEAADYVEERMSQALENLPVAGMRQIISGRYTHPMTGREVYVTVSGISGSSAAEAMRARVSQLRTTRDIYKDISFRRGEIAGQRAAVKAAQDDAGAFKAGQGVGAGDVTRPSATDVPETLPETTEDKERPEPKSRPGAYRGGGAIFDDF